MNVHSFFAKRPRAEIEAERKAAVRDEFEPKESLTARDAARILDQQHTAKLIARKTSFADPHNLDPVLRYHLRVDPEKKPE